MPGYVLVYAAVSVLLSICDVLWYLAISVLPSRNHWYQQFVLGYALRISRIIFIIIICRADKSQRQ